MKPLKCYGRRYGRLATCRDCEAAEWCREAADPKALTGPNAGPTGDDAAYEAAVATVEDERDTQGKMRMIDAETIGRLFHGLLVVCDSKEDRILAVVMRLAGKSYSQIGKRSEREEKTKQAVQKDIVRLAERCEALGKVLRTRFPEKDTRTLNQRLLDEFRKRDVPGRRMAVYRELAREFGLTTGHAVKLRIVRLKKVDGEPSGPASSARRG